MCACVDVHIFQIQCYTIVFSQISTILILRNLAKNSMMFVCLCQHRPTLLPPSKILIPEQGQAIFTPLCSQKLNRLNEQAKNKPSYLNGFPCKAILRQQNIVNQIGCLNLLVVFSLIHQWLQMHTRIKAHLYLKNNHNKASKMYIHFSVSEWQIEIGSVC